MAWHRPAGPDIDKDNQGSYLESHSTVFYIGVQVRLKINGNSIAIWARRSLSPPQIRLIDSKL
jgi:hypothetical protein